LVSYTCIKHRTSDRINRIIGHESYTNNSIMYTLFMICTSGQCRVSQFDKSDSHGGTEHSRRSKPGDCMAETVLKYLSPYTLCTASYPSVDDSPLSDSPYLHRQQWTTSAKYTQTRKVLARYACSVYLWFITLTGGTVAAAPLPFRPSDPALCGCHPLVTPLYYCRLGIFCVFCMCVCLLFCCILCCLLFLDFLYVCSIFSFSTLILLVLTCKTVSQITWTVLVETLNLLHQPPSL